MARKSIRDFSGGLVSYQSELDISDNQFQEFDNAINTKRGSITAQGATVVASSAISNAGKVTTEVARYRSEKDASGNDISTEWWLASNILDVYRQDISDGTSGTFASINTYSLGAECVTDGDFSSNSNWTVGQNFLYDSGSDNMDYSTSGDTPGILSQTSANMAIALKKDRTYKLQFTLSSIGSGGKAVIAITNSDNTIAYVSNSVCLNGTSTFYFSPLVSDGGICINPGNPSGTEDFTIDDITIKEIPKHDLLIHNQILRISDGSFNSSNNPKWYGHIKRDVFGQGQSRTQFRFREPPMAAAVNAWTLENTELTAPVVVPLEHAFDQGNVIDAVNQVGIFVYSPSSESLGFGGSSVDNTFTNKDKYTVTFIYDYIQESELGRDSNGDIGVFSQNDVDSDGKLYPGIQLVINTGTDLANWNKRITGINLYWQPEDDVDFYLVATYDVQDGFSDDPRAKNSSATTAIRGQISTVSNPGFWIPCLEPYGATTNDAHNLSSTNNQYNENTFAGDGTWDFTNSNFAADKAVIVCNNISDKTSLSSFTAELEKPTTFIANIRSISGATLRTGVSSTLVPWGNWRGEGYAEISTPTDDYPWNDKDAFVCTVSTDKVATWYLPNDGLKLATYNSLTGRAAETRLKPIKWNTAAVVGNKAFYANIDFKDENDQTIREKNRIVFTDNFKLDETVVGTKFLDVGKNDGDEITALHSAQNRLYVFKTRNIYVYRIQSAQSVNFILEKHIAGIGCLHKHAVVDTPYGICFADNRQVSLMRGTEISELSLLIRDTYQGFTLNPGAGSFSIGYDGINNMILFSDWSVRSVTTSPSTIFYGYNFDTRSWNKLNTGISTLQSNMVMDDEQNIQGFDTSSRSFENAISGSQNGDGRTLKVKTKRFDLELPDQFKRFTKIHITYLASGGGTVKIYADGETTESLSITLAAHTTLNCQSSLVNVLAKSIEVEVFGSSADIRIDGIDIDYDIEGSNP